MRDQSKYHQSDLHGLCMHAIPIPYDLNANTMERRIKPFACVRSQIYHTRSYFTHSLFHFQTLAHTVSLARSLFSKSLTHTVVHTLQHTLLCMRRICMRFPKTIIYTSHSYIFVSAISNVFHEKDECYVSIDDKTSLSIVQPSKIFPSENTCQVLFVP